MRRLGGKHILGKWKGQGLTVHHRVDFEPEAALQAIADYREAHSINGVRFIKTDHTRTILTFYLHAGETRKRICLKHYRRRGFFNSLKDLLRPPRSRRSWRSGNALTFRGIFTCKPLALVEVRKWGLLKESFLLMEDLSAFKGVHEYVLNNFDGISSRGASLKRNFTAALAQSLLALHRSDIYHGDLKTANILVEEKGDGWRFYYIDLDGVTLEKKVSLRRRAKNLAQIETSTPDCITTTDRVRFLHRYLEEAADISNSKAFTRLVVSQAGKRGRAW